MYYKCQSLGFRNSYVLGMISKIGPLSAIAFLTIKYKTLKTHMHAHTYTNTYKFIENRQKLLPAILSSISNPKVVVGMMIIADLYELAVCPALFSTLYM